MNDLEKTIIELDININDLEDKESKVYTKCSEVANKKQNTQKKVDRYSNKIKRITEELNELKIKRISLITVPAIGFASFGLVLLFGVPVSTSLAILALGGVTGYKMANDMVRNYLLTKGDDLLLSRLFPKISEKQELLDKACNDHKHYVSKLEELEAEESLLMEEYEELVDGIAKLREVSSSARDLHFKKLRREYLPYYTALEDVINKTIQNPNKFYTNICNGLNRKERRDIIEDIPCKNCSNCTNSSCEISDEEKTKMTDCKSWYNEVEIGMSKVLRR